MLGLRKGSLLNPSLYDNLNPTNGLFFSNEEAIFSNSLRRGFAIGPSRTTVNNLRIEGDTSITFTGDSQVLLQKNIEAGVTSATGCSIDAQGNLLRTTPVRREAGIVRYNPALCLPGLNTFSVSYASPITNPSISMTLVKLYSLSTCSATDIAPVRTFSTSATRSALTVQITNSLYCFAENSDDIIPLFDSAPPEVLAYDFYDNNVFLSKTGSVFSVVHQTRSVTIQLQGESITTPSNPGCNVSAAIFYEAGPPQVAHIVVLGSDLMLYYAKITMTSSATITQAQLRQVANIGNVAPYPHIFKAYGQLFLMYNGTGLLTRKMVSRLNSAAVLAADVLQDSQTFISQPLLTEHYFDPTDQKIYYVSNFTQFVVKFAPFEIHWQAVET